MITGELSQLNPVQVTSRDHRRVIEVESSTGDVACTVD